MAFDFDAAVQAPFRMQPGLRRLADSAGQLSASPRDSRHLNEKLAVLRADWPSALRIAPGFDPEPALHALARQATLEHPDAFGWDGEVAVAHRLGWALHGDAVQEAVSVNPPLPEIGTCLRDLPAPWRLAALLSLAFAEDFAIVDGHTAHIPWLAVALPSHWAPQDKVGRHFAEVHAPVADNGMLLAASDALAKLVSAPTRWERFVWTVTPHARLDAHPARATGTHWTPGDADSVAQQAHWRTERQTFIPVPDVAQALFTIRVDSQPLGQAIDSGHKAQRLHDALASMSPAVLHYRGLNPVRDALLQWLTRRARR